MALKPTIYKFNIALSDLERNVYDTLHLTVAQHPSETTERMLVRVLAYCLDADEQLAFTKGLSSTDEPDLWRKTLDGRTALWIDVGEPSLERIRKASHLAEAVKVYSFNTKSPTWWAQLRAECAALRVTVLQLPWNQVQQLATLAARTVDLSVTVTSESAYVAGERGECEVTWQVLQTADDGRSRG